jgi:hypothetical protein
MIPVSLNFMLTVQMVSQVERRCRTLWSQCRLASGLLTFSTQKAMIPATLTNKEHISHDK